LRQLVEFGVVKSSPIKDFIGAVSVGILRSEPMLDLAYQEDSRAEVDMNVVMTGGGRFVEVQATGEHNTFEDEQLAAMLALARIGIADLIEIQREVLRT
jgi:ribonuclease PH